MRQTAAIDTNKMSMTAADIESLRGVEVTVVEAKDLVEPPCSC